MEIIPIGTRATTVIDKTDGFITAVFIRQSGIEYEFSYFFNGEKKEATLSDFEFTTEPITKIKIGYRNG